MEQRGREFRKRGLGVELGEIRRRQLLRHVQAAVRRGAVAKRLGQGRGWRLPAGAHEPHAATSASPASKTRTPSDATAARYARTSIPASANAADIACSTESASLSSAQANTDGPEPEKDEPSAPA